VGIDVIDRLLVSYRDDSIPNVACALLLHISDGLVAGGAMVSPPLRSSIMADITLFVLVHGDLSTS